MLEDDPVQSWPIVTATMQVLRGHRILLAYPVAGFAFAVSFSFLFFGLEAWVKLNRHYFLVSFAVWYLLLMFIFTFVSVAFNHEVMRALSGERVSLRCGLAFARRRIKAIALWSLFAGLVGLLIHMLEGRFGFFGKLILRLTGVVWSVASVFVIPVMIRDESANPFDLLRKSSTLVRRKWDFDPVSFIGLGAVKWLIYVSLLALFITAFAGYVALATAVPALDLSDFWVCIVMVVVLYAMFLPVLMFDSIFCCALYIYATEGVVPAPYNPEQMDGAWRVRQS